MLSFSLLFFVVDLAVGGVFDYIAFMCSIVVCLDFGRCLRIHAGPVNCDRCDQDKRFPFAIALHHISVSGQPVHQWRYIANTPSVGCV